MESYSESYKKAGVDVTAGYKAVELMKSHIARTMTANVLTDIGLSLIHISIYLVQETEKDARKDMDTAAGEQ